MPARDEKGQANVNVDACRRIRKVLRIGHSYAITIPGTFVRRNASGPALYLATRIAEDGSYRVEPIVPTGPGSECADDPAG